MLFLSFTVESAFSKSISLESKEKQSKPHKNAHKTSVGQIQH